MERSHLYGVIKKRNNPNAPPTKIGLGFGLYSFGAEDEILPKPLKGSPTSRVALVRRLWRRAARLRIAYEFSISFVADHVGNATSHFVLVRHGKKCNCKHAFFAHVGRAPYFEAKPLMRRGGESLLQARLSCSRRAWEFTILSNLSSASKNGGAKMPCRFLAQKTRLSAGYALDGFVGGKGVCPFPAPCFAASSYALV